jgi:hypothetical protein
MLCPDATVLSAELVPAEEGQVKISPAWLTVPSATAPRSR